MINLLFIWNIIEQWLRCWLCCKYFQSLIATVLFQNLNQVPAFGNLVLLFPYDHVWKWFTRKVWLWKWKFDSWITNHELLIGTLSTALLSPTWNLYWNFHWQKIAEILLSIYCTLIILSSQNINIMSLNEYA